MLRGRFVDLEMVMETHETPRSRDPVLADIIKEIRSMRQEFGIVNERLNKLEEQQRTQHRDTNKHAVTDMFGASAVHGRYGSRRPALIITLRADLSEYGHVWNLTNEAYPFLLNDPSLLQSLVVRAFMKGLRNIIERRHKYSAIPSLSRK